MTNKNNFLILTFLIISILLTSCLTSSRFYTANRNPVPMFKKKGDLYLDLSTNIFNKADFTAGYAATKWLGGYIGVAGAYQDHTIKGDNSYNPPYTATYTEYKYTGTMLNGGLGYYLNRKYSKQFSFEIFGDFSYGGYKNKRSFRQSYSSASYENFSNGNYRRTGILMNVGYTNKREFLTFGYTARFSNITFSNATFSYQILGQEDIYQLNQKPNYQMLEHGIFGRIGNKTIKGQIQFSLYHCLNNIEQNDAINDINGALMFGLIISPNVFTKRENKLK